VSLDALSPHQRELFRSWLPDAVVERSHGWGLVATTVLEVVCGTERFIVKAGGPDDHHIARELEAHERWLAPWTSIGRAPVLVRGDADAKVLVTRFLPGELVQGSRCADEAGTYRQAGELLALLHGQGAPVVDETYEALENAKSLAWLDKPHRIDAETERRLRAEIAGWPAPSASLVPTHGDWQPRNWLVHEDLVSVIDFGRAALRPAMSDLCRLAAQDFARDPLLEAAFLDGYGPDPREPEGWHRFLVREAIGTAVWAHQVGDEPFEAQGHRMIATAWG
jgi:aminoglycoside phosphotransferase (APT) family kinase protein